MNVAEPLLATSPFPPCLISAAQLFIIIHGKPETPRFRAWEAGPVLCCDCKHEKKDLQFVVTLWYH